MDENNKYYPTEFLGSEIQSGLAGKFRFCVSNEVSMKMFAETPVIGQLGWVGGSAFKLMHVHSSWQEASIASELLFGGLSFSQSGLLHRIVSDKAVAFPNSHQCKSCNLL